MESLKVFLSNENAYNEHATVLENDKFESTWDNPACTQNVFVCNVTSTPFYFVMVNGKWRTFSIQDRGQ